MHPFIATLLKLYDAQVAHGTAITLNDFTEDGLRRRYGKLFDLQSHVVYVLDTYHNATVVADWNEFMDWIWHKYCYCDIEFVVAVPYDLAPRIVARLKATQSG